MSDASTDFRWYIDEFLFFRGTLHVRGWAFDPGQAAVTAVYAELPGEPLCPLPPEDYGQDSPDVAATFGPPAARCRFACRIEAPEARRAIELGLIFELADGRRVTARRLAESTLGHDPYHRLSQRFFEMLREEAGGQGRVLEIGSRSRSGNVSRHRLPAGWEYVGMDIKAGGNVDVVGDAHALSEVLPPASFDAVFSISTFEHLLMPWKAVLEINKVLKPGGLAMISTHQSFPLHEVPWDFFRFSDQAWHGLFNAGTGFEILQTALGEPASIVARLAHGITCEMDLSPAYIGSVALARKVADTRLTWEVSAADLVKSLYPH